MFGGGGKPRNRFSLLLLEENEYYFDDYSAFWYPDLNLEPTIKKKVKGRLKLCSYSVFFDPDDSKLPIMRYPFKHVSKIERWQPPLKSTIREEIFDIEFSMVVEMKENDVIAPYVFKKTNGTHKFSLQFESPSTILPRINELLSISRIVRTTERDAKLQLLIDERENSIAFDTTWLVDISEKKILEIRCVRVTPLVNNPGRLMITNAYVYFQPFNNANPNPVERYPISEIVMLVKRRHMLRHKGIEIFFANDRSVFFDFNGREERDKVFELIHSQPAAERLVHSDEGGADADLIRHTAQWQSGALSNFDYLMYLNFKAGRTFNDLTQYPVFPWVISDYTSPVLDLTKPSTFRDLSKPIGALNPTRLAMFRERYRDMPEPRFLYGTHYSAPGYVLFYLVRKFPEMMLRLQNGKFDAADRCFFSISETWQSVLTNHADVKELIPEFYTPPGDFLLNLQHLDLGVRSDQQRIDDVRLPPWAADAADFVAKCRQALESEHVSLHLHEWIDLIFGYKQRGPAAQRADNVFYHLTYEGAVDVDAIADPIERAALEAQIHEFGQTPSQLFECPHPRRNGPPVSMETIAPPRPLSTATTPRTAAAPSSPLDGRKQPLAALAETKTAADVTAMEPLAPRADTGGKRRLTFTGAASGWSDMDALGCMFSYKLHKDIVSGLALSRDGDTLFSVSHDSTLKLYSLKEKKQLRSVSIGTLSLSSCALHRSERLVAVGSWDNSVYIYSVDYGRIVATETAHDDAVSCLSLRDDTLLTGSWDSTVRLWKVSPSGGLAPLPDIEGIDNDAEIKCVEIDDHVNAAVAGTADGGLVLLDVRTCQVVRTIAGHVGHVVAAARFTHDGRRIVTVGSDGQLKVFDVSGAEVFSATAAAAVDFGLDGTGRGTAEEAAGDGAPLRSLCIDGRCTAVVGDELGALRVWDFANRRSETVRWKHSTKPITCVVAAENGECIVSGSEDCTIRLYTRSGAAEK